MTDDDIFDARHVLPVCGSCNGHFGCAACGGTGTSGFGYDEDPDVLTYHQWLRQQKDS